MFTGIVTAMGSVRAVEKRGDTHIVIDAPFEAGGIDIGASVACAGCCLTVVDRGNAKGGWFAVSASGETVSKTTIGSWKVGDKVNLERPLRVGDELGGHMVTGHIDAVGTVDRRTDDADWCTMWFRTPHELMSQIASKGSIAVDGVSLTLVDVEDERFSVALIPHTLSLTTLGRRHEGDRVNLETDVLAKYAEKAVRAILGGQR